MVAGKGVSLGARGSGRHRLRLLLIQRELPSRDREGAVLNGEEFPKTVTDAVLAVSVRLRPGS
jgi:hypothetical protein